MIRRVAPGLAFLFLVGLKIDVAAQLQIRLSKDEILAAMRSQSGYDPTATTNAGRFQANVILTLIRKSESQYPAKPILLIGHREWFRAFLELVGLTEEKAPLFARLAFKHKQDLLIDYDPVKIIHQQEKGPQPQIVANVKAYWPTTGESLSEYSFADTLSTPMLKVTNHSEILYRLLDFGDVIMLDRVEGITGRPTTGLLGALFSVIGEGRLVQVKMAISQDGLQIARAQAKKGFLAVTSTVTVSPDGKADKGIPAGRADLRIIEDRLKTEIEFDYKTFN